MRPISAQIRTPNAPEYRGHPPQPHLIRVKRVNPIQVCGLSKTIVSQGRPQQVTLGDLEACRQTITPLAVQDAAAVERMRDWAKTARPASSMIAQTTTKSLKTARFRNMN